MGTYRAEIDGQPFEFEAASDAAAGRRIDAEKARRSSVANVSPTSTPSQSVVPPPATQLVSPPTADLPPVSPETSATMGALLRGDPAARARVEGYEQGRQMGVPAAAGLALQQGTLRNFGDEVGALGAASGLPVGTPPIISAPIGAARRALGSEGADAAYTTELERLRGTYEGAQRANPVTTTVGEIAGGMAGPMPGSSIPAMAGVAAADSALAGAGAGETAGGRAQNAAAGAVVGGTLGAALGYVGRLASGLLKGTPNQVEGEAARRVQGALDIDASRMAPADRAAQLAQLDEAYRAGQPVVIGDTGGAATQRLARASKNLSAEADNTLVQPLAERARGQAARATNWLDEVTDAPTAFVARDKLQDLARAQNKPLYDKAYAEGASVWTPALQALTGSDTVRNAIKNAASTSSDAAALSGRPMVKNPFIVDDTTKTLTLPQGMTPSLEFWDHVQRNLRRAEEAAPRGGDEARNIGSLRKALNAELDRAVPSFGEARSVARGFFGAEDALDAGRGFLDLSKRAGSEAEAAAFNKLKPAEKELFALGVTDAVRQRFRSLADNQDISRVANEFSSPEMAGRLKLALGEKRAEQLVNYLAVEKGMSQFRNAVGGNSTTAQQVGDMLAYTTGGALAGGGLGAAGSFVGDNGELRFPSVGAAAGALAGALRVRNQKTNVAVANRVAEMLMSSDPAVLQRGAEILRNNKAMREGFNKFIGGLSRAAGQQTGDNWGAQ